MPCLYVNFLFESAVVILIFCRAFFGHLNNDVLLLPFVDPVVSFIIIIILLLFHIFSFSSFSFYYRLIYFIISSSHPPPSSHHPSSLTHLIIILFDCVFSATYRNLSSSYKEFRPAFKVHARVHNNASRAQACQKCEAVP